jgi:glutathione peroxidase-family protein
MRSNEAAFQATQKQYVDTQNEISDMSMQGYQSRSASQDRLRNEEVNMIHEENTMTNPWENKPHQVKSGYQHYYMNAKGQVIGSNNPNFNPNENSRFNHIEWRKMASRQR